MVKHINYQNFLTTPFAAVKQWELKSSQTDDVVLIETTGSSEIAVSLEYVEYTNGIPSVNRNCNIALEQQTSDILTYQEGNSGSGLFYPDSEPKNRDGTYKRLVYTQTKAAFYNKYRNPTQMFGMEFIDFPLGKTERQLSEIFRMFNIPQNIFGDRMISGSIRLYDTSLDDNVEIRDDGYQNLLAGNNLFSKIQEVRPMPNLIQTGSFIAPCDAIVDPTLEIQINYQTIPYGFTIDDAFLGGSWGVFGQQFSLINQKIDPVTITNIAIVGTGFIINLTSDTLPYTINTNGSMWFQIQKNVSGVQSASCVITTNAYDSPITLYVQGA